MFSNNTSLFDHNIMEITKLYNVEIDKRDRDTSFNNGNRLSNVNILLRQSRVEHDQ